MKRLARTTARMLLRQYLSPRGPRSQRRQLPITYRTGRFSFAATPSYLVPLHVPTGGDDRSFFYGTRALSRTFW